MKSKTRIFVLHSKEILYTALFLVFAIILVLLLVFMFRNKDDKAGATSTSKYMAGIYTSSIVLNDNVVDIQVVVDNDQINSVSIVNLEESVATMYPLLQPSMEDISAQLNANVPLEQVTYSSSNQYTVAVLLEAIENALDKATP